MLNKKSIKREVSALFACIARSTTIQWKRYLMLCYHSSLSIDNLLVIIKLQNETGAQNRKLFASWSPLVRLVACRVAAALVARTPLAT